ncbi:MAG: calcium-translocating P-type ATPase, SERCA-type [Clostridiales bacterium]|uniref:calcium-translocating P-type ATPase, SERCA-type n=1 Tax=Clostridium sp. N3C TaxID=1776758 RepID=UPI00092DF354|nr:calcium-translocating P-type ATPase, SERCA-type [Clostridium sp. N3C]NLZ47317.1 calcium-translocating P-type ATPase, SERCA-type [Clostridiales bacterium]SCN21332.1 Calcium-transporting ATPase [Clostridium sp. N3C]
MIEEKELLRGLTTAEAERRLKEHGLNVLEEKESLSPIKIFLSQFNEFMIWVLIAATIVSGLMGEKADAITILIIIFMNAFLGFIQEYRTEKSLDALRKMAAPTAKVIRDGKVQVINAEYIVIGDIIVLESGDRVPADSVILQSSNVMVDESLLTGESVGVNKSAADKENNLYMGTILLTGKATAKVIQTGMNTEMGKIADMLQNIEDERSPLKEKLNSLGKIMVVICLVICIIVTILGIIRGNSPIDMFLMGVSLAVAAIPEGLPAIVTVALALGVSRMLKRNALVRKLPAVETLGCTSIICSDKTGTLTENKMTVKAMYYNSNIIECGDRKSFKGLINSEILKKIFTYCSDCSFDYSKKDIASALFGDPTETALIRAFFEDSKELKTFMSKALRTYDIPFDSNRKMMTVVMKENGKETCYVKGAPERILDKCNRILIQGEVRPLTATYKRAILKSVETMSNKALRCIAGAYKDSGISHSKSVENDLIFVGIAGIIDPPRKEVKDAVLKCKLAGIKVIMITGDHKNTAYAIGKDLDICKSMDEAITGEELDKLTDKELSQRIDKLSIFARVSPQHKLRIVKVLKRKNKIVAMTGDGVNDAPAVKEADIGISMGISGTDVTKEASAMILMDDNFATIVAAVEEGRVIYGNIRKFIRYLLSCNLGEVLTMFLASLFYLEVPLKAIQILFVNLATDGLPAIALGVDPPEKDIMYEKPRPKDESVFARGLTEKIAIRGSLIGICTLLAFIVSLRYNYSLECSRTIALSTLVISQLIHVFECRSEKHSLFEINPFTNPYLIGAVMVSISALLSIIYIEPLQGIFSTVPLNLGQWLIVIFFSGIIAFINSMYLFITKK